MIDYSQQLLTQRVGVRVKRTEAGRVEEPWGVVTPGQVAKASGHAGDGGEKELGAERSTDERSGNQVCSVVAAALKM
jgi:hypothetical protein